MIIGRLVASSLLVSAFVVAADPPSPFTPTQRKYWAFQPVRRAELPILKDGSTPVNPIDRFVRARLEANKITPVGPSDRVTLIRRLSFDLVGLPPTPDEVDAFVADQAPDAYDKLVDRLLASPHYGERWARHWLDLARYAESEGFKERRNSPECLAVPGLCRQGVQRKQTVRSLRERTNRG